MMKMKIVNVLATVLTLVLTVSLSSVSAQTMTKDVTVVELNQTPGAFDVTSLDLAPGKYLFKVTNTNVDHEVGFVIQAAADAEGDVMKTAVPNSFGQAMIAEGESTTSGIVELTAGDYVYSCPLNPTPKYKLTVKK